MTCFCFGTLLECSSCSDLGGVLHLLPPLPCTVLPSRGYSNLGRHATSYDFWGNPKPWEASTRTRNLPAGAYSCPTGWPPRAIGTSQVGTQGSGRHGVDDMATYLLLIQLGRQTTIKRRHRRSSQQTVKQTIMSILQQLKTRTVFT